MVVSPGQESVRHTESLASVLFSARHPGKLVRMRHAILFTVLLLITGATGCLPDTGNGQRGKSMNPGEQVPDETEQQAEPAKPEPPPHPKKHVYREMPPPKIKGQSLQQRRQRLLWILQHPHARYFRETRDILLNRIDPLSVLAALTLGRIKAPGTEQALAQALSDYRPSVREQALKILVDLRAAVALESCRRLFAHDPHVAVRGAAARGLGIFRDRNSLPALRQAFARGNPTIRPQVAWAMARMDDSVGLQYLQRIALDNDLHVSPGAITGLGSLQNPDAVVTICQCLFAEHDKIRMSALQALLGTTPENRRIALERMREQERKRVLLREKILLAIAGRGRVPPGCARLLAAGSNDDKRLTLRAMLTAGTLRDIPAIIIARNDKSGEIREKAYQTLAFLAKKYKLPFAPGEAATMRTWQRWWFSLHRLVACSRHQATLRFPDGKPHGVRIGTRLHWSAPVVKIHPGGGPRGVKGGYIEVLCDRSVVRIE